MKDNSNVLKLTLKKQWFDLMITGEKDFELRNQGKWIESRLFTKEGFSREYDYVRFTNGYGSDKPFFTCKFICASLIFKMNKTFSDGSKLVFSNTPTWEISLGEILQTGNIKNEQNENKKTIEVSVFVHMDNGNGDGFLEKNDFSVVKFNNFLLVKDDFERLQESLEDVDLDYLETNTLYSFVFEATDQYEDHYKTGHSFSFVSASIV